MATTITISIKKGDKVYLIECTEITAGHAATEAKKALKSLLPPIIMKESK